MTYKSGTVYDVLELFVDLCTALQCHCYRKVAIYRYAIA